MPQPWYTAEHPGYTQFQRSGSLAEFLVGFIPLGVLAIYVLCH